MIKVFSLVMIIIAIISCRKDVVEPTQSNVLQPSNEQDDYYSYNECDYTDEFLGEYAYFKGTITDTTSGLSLEGYRVNNTQGFTPPYTIVNGEYFMSTVRGELVGNYNHYFQELDTVTLDIVGANNTVINTIYLVADTLIYNDTIIFDIQF